MKNSFLQLNRLLLIGIPLLFIATSIWLVHSSYFQQHPIQLSKALTLDFLITIPLIYFLLIRKQNIPKFTVVSVFVLCIIAASYILPSDQQAFLSQIKTIAIPLIEITVLTVLVVKIRQAMQVYKQQKMQTLDFYNALLQVTQAILPKGISHLFATEIAVIYYAFINWEKRPLAANEFTYYKKSGVAMLLYTFIGLMLMETILLHFVLHKYHYNTIAWVLTGLSMYASLQFIALIRSMSKRPITIGETDLYLRYGFFSQTTIPLEKIARIERNTRSLPNAKKMIPLSPLGELDSHNILVHLKKEHTLQAFYGIKKQFTTIAIYIDEKDCFEKALNHKLDELNNVLNN